MRRAVMGGGRDCDGGDLCLADIRCLVLAAEGRRYTAGPFVLHGMVQHGRKRRYHV